jgi:hypothetical protein
VTRAPPAAALPPSQAFRLATSVKNEKHYEGAQG